MADTTESRSFKIVVFILSAVVVGVSIANIVYFNRIRDGTCQAVSHGTATTMVWVNAILLVIAIIILLWSLWRLLFSQGAREQVKHYMVSPTAGMGMGYMPATAPMAVATSPGQAAMVVAPGEAATITQATQYL